MASVSDSTPRSIIDLLSSYSILSALAPWLSTLDLFHLGLTCRSANSYILDPPAVFKSLRRQCLCDGHGLVFRQTKRRDNYDNGKRHLNPHLYGDDEVEVRLFNTKCDEAGALPCVKCGINICEECRIRPRAAPASSYATRLPHIDATCSLKNIYCLCPTCDVAEEQEVAGKFLNELCDCDIYTRWICGTCYTEEYDSAHDYFDKHTRLDWNWDPELPELDLDDATYGPSMTLQDHQHERAFWCICGAMLPQSTIPRCFLCKRRHLPPSAWYTQWKEMGRKIPFFDDDPDYPRWVSDRDGKYPDPYPRLGYRRPGDEDTTAL